MKTAPAALALALMLAACDRQPAQAPASQATRSQETPTRPPAAPAAPARPLVFKQTDPAADVALTLPAEINRYSALHAALYDRETALLKDFTDKAEADRKATDGEFPWRQYASQRQWFVEVASPPLLSLRGMWFDYTGGAHPNHGATALLWDTEKNTEIKPTALFRPGADTTVLDKRICDAVAAAKRHRGGVPLDSMFSCPKWTETALVLAPSTEPGKIGGLTALIDPYVVGPYAEGDYEVTIPSSAFRALLAPAYADAFAGSPKSPGDPNGWPSVQMDVK